MDTFRNTEYRNSIKAMANGFLTLSAQELHWIQNALLNADRTHSSPERDAALETAQHFFFEMSGQDRKIMVTTAAGASRGRA